MSNHAVLKVRSDTVTDRYSWLTEGYSVIKTDGVDSPVSAESSNARQQALCHLSSVKIGTALCQVITALVYPRIQQQGTLAVFLH